MQTYQPICIAKLQPKPDASTQLLQEKPKLPFIPGSEVSGVVSELGEMRARSWCMCQAVLEYRCHRGSWILGWVLQALTCRRSRSGTR